MFKESVVVLPLLIAVWWGLEGRRPWRWLLPLVGVVLLYLLVRFLLVGQIGGYSSWSDNLLRPWRLASHGVVYLLQMLLPAPLFLVERDLWDTVLYLLALPAGAVLLFFWRSPEPFPRLRRWMVLLLLWTALSLLPVLPLKPALGHLLNSRYVPNIRSDCPKTCSRYSSPLGSSSCKRGGLLATACCATRDDVLST